MTMAAGDLPAFGAVFDQQSHRKREPALPVEHYPFAK
jgi:hypothetical protein